MDTDNREPITVATPEATKAMKKATKEKKPAETESVYTAKELSEAHNIFKTSHAIVAVALKLAKKEKATIKEAERIIEEFKNKEVK